MEFFSSVLHTVHNPEPWISLNTLKTHWGDTEKHSEELDRKQSVTFLSRYSCPLVVPPVRGRFCRGAAWIPLDFFGSQSDAMFNKSSGMLHVKWDMMIWWYAHIMFVPMHLQQKRAAHQPRTLDTEGTGPLQDYRDQSIWLRGNTSICHLRSMCALQNLTSILFITSSWFQTNNLWLTSLLSPSLLPPPLSLSLLALALSRPQYAVPHWRGCHHRRWPQLDDVWNCISTWLPRTLAKKVTGHKMHCGGS